MDNRQHGERVYNLLKDNVPAKYEVLFGTNYDIYEKGRTPLIPLSVAAVLGYN